MNHHAAMNPRVPIMKGTPMSNQDDLARRLLEPLREEPSGRPRFDVDRAMAEGRRLRRMRRWSITAAVSAVTLVTAGGGTAVATALRDDDRTPLPLPSVTAAAPRKALTCEMSTLPTDGIPQALVTAGDPSGRYLAGRVYRPGKPVRTIVWRDGQILSRTAMPGSGATFRDINSLGTGVGTSYGSDDRIRSYVYQKDKYFPMSQVGATAMAINDAGVVVGSAGSEEQPFPVRWNYPGGEYERLDLPVLATSGMASAVDEDGTIVGKVSIGDDEATGYLWLPGSRSMMMPLPEVDGRKADAFWPTSIGGGLVAGRAVFDDENSRGFTSMTFDLRTEIYRALPANLGSIQLLAADGSVAGVTGRTPAIVSGEVITKLPVDERKEYDVESFSDDGRVVAGSSGFTKDEKTANEPILWRCQTA